MKFSKAFLAIGLLSAAAVSIQAEPIMGFSKDASSQQETLETRFRANKKK